MDYAGTLLLVLIVVLWCIAMWGDNSIPRDKHGRPDR